MPKYRLSIIFSIISPTPTCGTVQQAKNLLTIVKKSRDNNFKIDLFVGKIKKQEWKALEIVAELHGDGDW